jgi:hypothetical protein
MEVDDRGIHVHQSDLDTFSLCPERHRLQLTAAERMPPNEAAASGTCTHEGIRAVLADEIDANAIGDYVKQWSLQWCERTPGIRYVKWSQPTHIAEHAVRCARAFVRELYPLIPRGGDVEARFDVPFMKFKDRQVFLTGAADYINSPLIYDWKTASRKFDQRVKQRTAIQPTVYATAAVHGAFGPGFEWPVRFTYGVMVRGNEMATTQLVNVQRTHAHEGWLRDKLYGYLNTLTLFGTDAPWPRDDDHYLCNETWCPVWSMCKGARLSHDEDNWAA